MLQQGDDDTVVVCIHVKLLHVRHCRRKEDWPLQIEMQPN